MEKFTRVTLTAAPFLQDDIGTTDILPATEIAARRDATAAARALFGHWRYTDLATKTPNPDFILNKEPWKHAGILIGGRNFGRGSSFEAAPRAVRAFGFRAVIAPSFGGIFANNCLRNGVVPVILDEADVHAIAAEVTASGGATPITIDLDKQVVEVPNVGTFAFSVPPALREMLLAGLDEIDWAMARGGIEAFRAADRQKRPWAYIAS